jgi:phosphate transport system protein
MITRRTLHNELRAIQDDLVRMGSLVDTAVSQAVHALLTRDTRRAQQIALNDSQINGLRFHAENLCLTCIATQQPTATDLRTTVSAMIIANELERMGDYAAGIARTVLRLGDEPAPAPPAILLPMADACRQMVRQSIDAYVAHDEALARAVAARDDEVDQFYNRIFKDILKVICDQPRDSTRVLYLLFTAHNLERIGDRAVNIAERVIFVTSGQLQELNAGPAAPEKTEP